MKEEKNILGQCPLCGRDLIEGPTVNEHHLLPKSLKGKDTITLHKICHSKIHSVFTERELFNYYHTIERLLENEEIQKFVKWVAKKEPEYRGKNRRMNDKGSRNRR